MVQNNNHTIIQEKTKLLTKFGFFFGIVIIGPLIIFLMIWFSLDKFFPNENQLLVSHSPHNQNKIKIFRKEDFPAPTLHIYYDDEHIVKTKLPDDISVEWKNDDEANIMLIKQGKDPDIINVIFN